MKAKWRPIKQNQSLSKQSRGEVGCQPQAQPACVQGVHPREPHGEVASPSYTEAFGCPVCQSQARITFFKYFQGIAVKGRNAEKALSFLLGDLGIRMKKQGGSGLLNFFSYLTLKPFGGAIQFSLIWVNTGATWNMPWTSWPVEKQVSRDTALALAAPGLLSLGPSSARNGGKIQAGAVFSIPHLPPPRRGGEQESAVRVNTDTAAC